jgi:SAM-dependent methyltransferase
MFVSDTYSKHHVVGRRLGGSVLAQARRSLFSAWLGGSQKIIDLGGRDGTLSGSFAGSCNLTILDADPNALASAKENFDVDTILGDLNGPLDINSNEFDAAILGEVIEHLPYPGSTLKEVNRILKPGGILVGSLPLAYHLQDRLRVFAGMKLSAARDPTHLQFFRFKEFIEMLASAGFDCCDWVPLKGGKLASFFPNQFCRNIAFCAISSEPRKQGRL